MTKKEKCLFCGNEVRRKGTICKECVSPDNPKGFVICKNCGERYYDTPITEVHKNARLGLFCKRRGDIYIVEISFCKKCDPEGNIEIIRIEPHKIFPTET